MKIIHTSDWHLGHVLYNLDRNAEHEAFLVQLRDLVRSEKPDALLVSGDIFDSAQPSIPAQRLYNRMMIDIARKNPDTTIVVTAGNHDGASRQELFSELWDEAFNVKFIGKIGYREDGTVDLDKFIVHIPGKGFIVAVPYIYNENYPESTDEDRLPIQDFHQRLLDRVADLNGEGLPVMVGVHSIGRGISQDEAIALAVKCGPVEAVGRLGAKRNHPNHKVEHRFLLDVIIA